MDLQAFYLQAAEAAATVTVHAAAEAGDDAEEPKLPSRAAVLIRFDVQQAVGLRGGDDAAERFPRHVGKTIRAAAAEMADSDAVDREGGGLSRVLICPECGKAFASDKAMHGHLRAHPARGYKGASRPGTPAASVPAAAAGDARPRTKAPQRKEVLELPSFKWPVTAKRSRIWTIASPPVSADPAAVLLPEPPAPLLLEPARGEEPLPMQLEEPPHGVEPAVLLLEPRRSEEEEAAMTLLDLYQRMRTNEPPKPAEDQLPMQVDNAVAEAEQQMPQADQLEPPADHVAGADQHHAPVEHIFGIIVGSQAAEAEQQSNATAAGSKGKEPMEPEPVGSDALVLFRDKLLFPGPSKRPRKRALPFSEQTQPSAAAPAAEKEMPPPLRRIPSPASDRKFECPTCSKKFPTHQALGGHMANHNRAQRSAAAQNMDGLAAAHAVHNIMVQHQLRQDALLRKDVLPPVARAPKTHSCSRCDLTFPTGQALGGHMRKHWLEEKMRAVPATALAVPFLDAVAPDAAPGAPANALAVAPANALALALAVPAAVPAALASALMVPVPAAVAPNGKPRDFQLDLNEMPME